jgi:copper resistance protein B
MTAARSFVTGVTLIFVLCTSAVGAEPTDGEAEHVPPAPPAQPMTQMPYKDMVALMGMDDSASLSKVMLDQLELDADHDRATAAWDAQAWYGTDYNKLWLKSEGERATGNSAKARVEALWDRIGARWWNLQAGLRYDLRDGPARGWAAVGVQGLAPYRFDVEATVYLGDAGRTAARFKAEHDFLFTQRLILQPELEANLYGKTDAARQIGSGLSDLQLALRLRYEFRREVAPYLGVAWRREFGTTAQFTRAIGADASALQWTAGARLWF